MELEWMHGLIRWLVFTYLPSESDCSYFCDFNNCIKFSENENNKILRTFGINQKYLWVQKFVGNIEKQLTLINSYWLLYLMQEYSLWEIWENYPHFNLFPLLDRNSKFFERELFPHSYMLIFLREHIFNQFL